jgi:hypothetical protein
VTQWANDQFHPELEPDVPSNDRGMYLLAGDSYECEAYHGAYQASWLFLAAAGTDHAALFLPTSYMAAVDHAKQYEGAVQKVSVLEICHDRVFAIFGA